MSEERDDNIRRVISADDKREGESKNILTKLFRRILKDRGITPSRWSQLMNRYLNDPANKIPLEGKKRSSDRNNLNKELARPNMSLNVFMKGLRLLNPVRARITLDLEWHFGITTQHVVTFAINKDDREEYNKIVKEDDKVSDTVDY